MRLCTEVAQVWKEDGRLPPETHIVWGSDVWERREGRDAHRGKAWHKGADGLFVVEERQPNGPHLMVFRCLLDLAHGLLSVSCHPRVTIPQRLDDQRRISGT